MSIETLNSNAAESRARTRRRNDAQKASVWVYILVILATAIFVIPFVWLVLASLASRAQFTQGTLGLLDLSSPQWSNFYEAVTRKDFLGYARNSLLLATITAVLTTLSSATVGFAFARLRARGQKTLFIIVISTMMIPSIAYVIPSYVLFARVGLVNTYWPWVLWGLAGLPFLIFLFRQFFAAIPLDLEDAAMIDGAGWVRTYLLIFLPLARPAILTSLILSFTWTWGDYLAPKLFLNLDNTTLAVAVSDGYLDERGNALVTLQAAAGLLYVLPVIVVFLFAQRHFMGSSIGTSVKG